MGKSCFRFLSASSIVLILLILAPLFSNKSSTSAQPLYTNSRWIVDENKQRVKLACVNWVSHVDTVVAEGLSKAPAEQISKRISSMGFNCVRLTWPTFLATNDTLATLTVRQSFLSLGLTDEIPGIQANNPSILDLSLINAFQEVVSILGHNDIMVILDNHLSKPGWCCGMTDGNGFFGDENFDPNVWIDGLTRMAKLFKGVPAVVGMSLRNELRGPKQNVADWYRYMQEGAEAVHSVNPAVLVILSGLSFDKDLSFLRNKPVNLSFSGKIVFEMHRYSFTDGNAWTNSNANQICGNMVADVMQRSGFLVEQGWPLFVSEFGLDLRGTDVGSNRFMNCFLGGVLAELDLEWALWTLQGSYYLREGAKEMEEFYGILSFNWNQIRDVNFLHRISFLREPLLQGPGESQKDVHKIIYHPLSGNCVAYKSKSKALEEEEEEEAPLRLSSCKDGAAAWSYTAQKSIQLVGTQWCLTAVEAGRPPRLTEGCENMKWEAIPDSKMHLSFSSNSTTQLCLAGDGILGNSSSSSSSTLLTQPCECLSGDSECDPATQWFKLVDSTKGIIVQ